MLENLEKAGTKLQHYKGGTYTVLDVVTHTETGEEMLSYLSDKDNKKWVRPLHMFYEQVEYKGKQMPRFTVIH